MSILPVLRWADGVLEEAGGVKEEWRVYHLEGEFLLCFVVFQIFGQDAPRFFSTYLFEVWIECALTHTSISRNGRVSRFRVTYKRKKKSKDQFSVRVGHVKRRLRSKVPLYLLLLLIAIIPCTFHAVPPLFVILWFLCRNFVIYINAIHQINNITLLW